MSFSNKLFQFPYKYLLHMGMNAFTLNQIEFYLFIDFLELSADLSVNGLRKINI